MQLNSQGNLTSSSSKVRFASGGMTETVRDPNFERTHLLTRGEALRPVAQSRGHLNPHPLALTHPRNSVLDARNDLTDPQDLESGRPRHWETVLTYEVEHLAPAVGVVELLPRGQPAYVVHAHRVAVLWVVRRIPGVKGLHPHLVGLFAQSLLPLEGCSVHR